MSGLTKLTSLFASALFALLAIPSAQAAMNISLSGSSEISNAALERYKSNSISANVSLGLGDHFMVGMTHRRSFDNKVGLKRTENAETKALEYIPFEDNGESTTNSVDLTIIPYNGVISPMVFGGVARRDYYNEIEFMGSRIISRQSMFPIPNYGFGTIIQLGAGMHLKITQTYSPGVQTTLEDGEEISRLVKDSYTQIWLGYRL